MELAEDEIKIRDDSVTYIRAHRKELIERFIISKKPLPLSFTTIFMAGSPGSGKTEFSQRYIPLFPDPRNAKIISALHAAEIDSSSFESLLIRIDVDEIRSFLPHYVRGDAASGVRANAHVVQRAANEGLDILRTYCFDNEISFLHDGTFGNYTTMKEMVRKSIETGRQVYIYYLYIDPLAAWAFTKAREFLEGRNILKDKFIEQFFKSRENVDRMKLDFGDGVVLHCILKNAQNEIVDTAFNSPSVSLFLDTKRRAGAIRDYTEEELMTVLN